MNSNNQIRVSMHKALMLGLADLVIENGDYLHDVARASLILKEKGARAGIAEMIQNKSVCTPVIDACVRIYDYVNQKRREYEIINTYRSHGAGGPAKNDQLTVGLASCSLKEPETDLGAAAA